MAPPPARQSPMLDRPQPLLFRVAYSRARRCYCYGCICLTPEERRYERRVFRLARAWSRALKYEADRLAHERREHTA